MGAYLATGICSEIYIDQKDISTKLTRKTIQASYCLGKSDFFKDIYAKAYFGKMQSNFGRGMA